MEFSEKKQRELATELLNKAIQATDMGSDWPIFSEPLSSVKPYYLGKILEENGIKRFIIASVFPELLQFLQYFTEQHMGHPTYYIKAAGDMGDGEYTDEIPGILLVNSEEWEEYVEIEHKRIN